MLQDMRHGNKCEWLVICVADLSHGVAGRHRGVLKSLVFMVVLAT
jgi:hypothetical protein